LNLLSSTVFAYEFSQKQSTRNQELFFVHSNLQIYGKFALGGAPATGDVGQVKAKLAGQNKAIAAGQTADQDNPLQGMKVIAEREDIIHRRHRGSPG
jgi:hypothetical protein